MYLFEDLICGYNMTIFLLTYILSAHYAPTVSLICFLCCVLADPPWEII